MKAKRRHNRDPRVAPTIEIPLPELPPEARAKTLGRPPAPGLRVAFMVSFDELDALRYVVDVARYYEALPLPFPFVDPILALYSRALATMQGERVCIVCGCTEAHACKNGCHWIATNVCSSHTALSSKRHSSKGIIR